MEDEQQPLLPGLPDDLALRCLAHLPWQLQGSLLLVAKRWHALVVSGELAGARKLFGTTEFVIGLGYEWEDTDAKPGLDIQCFAFNPFLLSRGLVTTPRRRPKVSLSYSGIILGVAGESVAFLVKPDDPEKDGEAWAMKYDSQRNLWRTCALSNCARSAGLGVSASGQLVVAGGYELVRRGQRMLPLDQSRVECYNLEEGTRIPLPSMPVPSRLCSVTFPGGNVCVASSDPMVNTKMVAVYDPNRSTWRTLEDFQCATRTPLTYLAAAGNALHSSDVPVPYFGRGGPWPILHKWYDLSTGVTGVNHITVHEEAGSSPLPINCLVSLGKEVFFITSRGKVNIRCSSLAVPGVMADLTLRLSQGCNLNWCCSLEV